MMITSMIIIAIGFGFAYKENILIGWSLIVIGLTNMCVFTIIAHRVWVISNVNNSINNIINQLDRYINNDNKDITECVKDNLKSDVKTWNEIGDLKYINHHNLSNIEKYKDVLKDANIHLNYIT